MMNQKESSARDDWRTNLAEMFAEVDREDRAFADAVVRRANFYKTIARPALDAIKNELARYGRLCDIGEDDGRVFIIVRKAGGEIEFQYAVVAEVKIEGITPYVHSWLEPTASSDDATQNDDDEEGGDDEEKDDEDDSEQNDDDDGSDRDSDDSADAKPPNASHRIKIVEVLDGWQSGSDLSGVTSEEITRDFVSRYTEAVALSRAGLHASESSAVEDTDSQ